MNIQDGMDMQYGKCMVLMKLAKLVHQVLYAMHVPRLCVVYLGKGGGINGYLCHHISIVKRYGQHSQRSQSVTDHNK
jgi:hypothetical protein